MSSARPWLKIKVLLVSGRGEELETPPGRVMLVSANHSLAELADAIDLAFARWDTSHLHMFMLPNGLALASEDDEMDAETGATTSNTRLGGIGHEKGSGFQYVFDLGDEWTHDCEVIELDVDPIEELGAPPPQGPVTIDGWGWIPDQYGRATEAVEDE
jgi:hypothetical protein